MLACCNADDLARRTQEVTEARSLYLALELSCVAIIPDGQPSQSLKSAYKAFRAASERKIREIVDTQVSDMLKIDDVARRHVMVDFQLANEWRILRTVARSVFDNAMQRLGRRT